MPERILLAGPWQGEFGWELMRWNPHIRYIARTESFSKIIVAIQKGHEALYQDFATGFLYIPRGRDTDGWKDKHLDPKFGIDTVTKFKSLYFNDELNIIEPNKATCFETNNLMFQHFGTKHEKRYDILIHARATTKTNSGKRNWSTIKWAQVVNHFLKQGLSIASVGVKGQAYHIVRTENLLNYPLSDLMNVMANSRLIIGPSSGPMHLATLCECPQLVWTDKKKWLSLGMQTNRYRYETLWNPFKVKTSVLDNCNWQPQVTEVVTAADNML